MSRKFSALPRICFVLALAAAPLARVPSAGAAEDGQYQTASGLSVYLGVMPAELVKGLPSHSSESSMHGGIPRGRHEYHVVAAVFDSAGGARISDATITAKISGLALSGPQITLEPMKIADTTTFGGFVNLPGTDRYTIKLTIQRAGSQQPVVLDFKYDHGR